MRGTMHVRLAALGLSLALVLLTFGGVSTQAADTDIYFFSDQPDPQDEPLVMFSLDWRPNLNGTAGGCTSLSENSCPQFWALQEEGYLDVAAGAKVRNIDYYIAVLRKVFDALGDKGLKVGLTMNHDAESCAGPQTGNDKCTNGGFITMGFKSLSQGGADELLEKLTRVSKMNQKGTESPSGQGHSYQGAELFFEFYRYLIGGGIYNGHNGWKSFDDGGTVVDPTNSNRTISLTSFNLDDTYKRASNQEPSTCTASTCFNNLGLPSSFSKAHFSWDSNVETNNHDQYVSPLAALSGATCGPRIYTINILFQVANQDNNSDSEILKNKSQGGMGFDPSSNNAFAEVIGFLNKNDLGDGTFGSAPDLAGSQNVVSYFLVKDSNTTTNKYAKAGGAGQQIPGLSYKTISGDPGLVNSSGGGRQLYYDTPGSATAPALAALNADDAGKADTVLRTALGVISGTDTEKQAQTLCLLKYARGYAVQDDCSSAAGRSWMLGDVLHSRPLVINYGGSTSNPDVRLMFGGNDGFFRMLRNTTSGGDESGQEVWAFMPRAVMGIVGGLKDNGEGEHLYGVDGVPSAYIFDSNRDGNLVAGDGDKVWAFIGLRRGGRAYYGLDVSTPDSPSLLWRIDA
jgi:hypothetical protein